MIGNGRGQNKRNFCTRTENLEQINHCIKKALRLQGFFFDLFF